MRMMCNFAPVLLCLLISACASLHVGSEAAFVSRESCHPASTAMTTSPVFWGDEIVYEIQVDRFNNGDPTNDRLSMDSSEMVNPDPYLDPRNGGDLRGIVDRLDYLRDLGVTTLMLTPIYRHNGSYHGYCPIDFTEIDPGFGTNSAWRNCSAIIKRRLVLRFSVWLAGGRFFSGTVFS